MRSLLAIVSFLLATAGAEAQGLQIEVKSGPAPNTKVIGLSGRIENGDSLRVRGELSRVPPGTAVIAELAIAGGRMREAISVGRLFHQIGVATVVPQKAVCASPCQVIFFSGRSAPQPERGRVKHSTGNIQFTAYNSNYPERAYTAADLDREIAAIQAEVLALGDHLNVVGADMELLARMFERVPAGQFKRLSDDDVLELGASVVDDRTGQFISGKALSALRK